MQITYNELKDQLLMLIDESSAMENVSECPCDELREKILNNRFNLVVVGQFKRGKTTFINALLGTDLLAHCRSSAYLYSYGYRIRAKGSCEGCFQ